MDTVFLIIGLIIIFLLLVILYKMWSPEDNEDIEKVVRESLEESQRGIRGDMNSGMQAFSRIITDNQNAASEAQQRQLMSLENRFRSMESSNNEKLEAMRLTMIRQLDAIQDENQKKLDAIQNTVNEKLETQLQQSFKLVSERLEKVYTSLGEMQSIASGVGDLKKVLSNVKTRGILGEIQLGNILEEILAPELYDREVPTIPNSRDHVEFAVKLPNGADGKSIYLPIDSKFPGDTYAALQDAYESGDRERVAAAKKNLEIVIKKCAGDIRSKYVSPPYTTNFGIMFLPFEGLYAEAVNLGLVETLQRDYSVSIAGPSTMAAISTVPPRTLALSSASFL